MKFASHLTLLLAINFLAHADWKQWRGPTGQGHAKAKLPIKWSETENVTWRTSVPGKGWSSPVIEENQIWDLPVVDNNNDLVGLLHLHNILRKILINK